MDRTEYQIDFSNKVRSIYEKYKNNFANLDSDISVSSKSENKNLTIKYLICSLYDLFKECRRLGRTQEEIVEFLTKEFNKEENKKFKLGIKLSTFRTYTRLLNDANNRSEFSDKFKNITIDEELSKLMNRLKDSLTDFINDTTAYQRKPTLSGFKLVETFFDEIKSARMNNTSFRQIVDSFNDMLKKEKMKLRIDETTLKNYYYKIKKSKK